MEGGCCFSKWGFRFGAAHVRLQSLRQLHGSRAIPFQNWALAEAPRTFVLKVCNIYTDRGRFLFKMGLSPRRRASSYLTSCNNYTDGGRLLFKTGLSLETSWGRMTRSLKCCSNCTDERRFLVKTGLSLETASDFMTRLCVACMGLHGRKAVMIRNGLSIQTC